LKVTNPNDLKAIIQSVEGLTTQTYREIQRLPIGVALISGAGLQMPIMTEIRTRETSHGGKSVNISKSGDAAYNPPKIPSNPSPPQPVQPQPNIEPPSSSPPPTPKSDNVTEKAINVTRVANRLGWIDTNDPGEAMKTLTKEAEKMNENVYKYLESLSKLGINFCQKNNPQCNKCPMNAGCKYKASHQTEKKGFFKK